MALIEYTLSGKINKEDIAIQRIKNYDPIASGMMDEPYYTAISGGKDSDVIRILCGLAGVKHELWHNHTTVDAPETVYYVRSIPDIQISYPIMSMWQLIVFKKIPPTMRMRYCCEYLKEGCGENRLVMTGVRWAESIKRKANRGSLEIMGSNKHNKTILNADNTNNRKLLENCQLKSKWVLNPIVDWTDEDVWEFLNSYGCKSNPLYQCGYKRVGCIGCPMAGQAKQIWQFERYPKYKEAYIRAFDRMIIAREESGLSNKGWETGEEVFKWWISHKTKTDENQLELL